MRTYVRLQAPARLPMQVGCRKRSLSVCSSPRLSPSWRSSPPPGPCAASWRVRASAAGTPSSPRPVVALAVRRAGAARAHAPRRRSQRRRDLGSRRPLAGRCGRAVPRRRHPGERRADLRRGPAPSARPELAADELRPAACACRCGPMRATAARSWPSLRARRCGPASAPCVPPSSPASSRCPSAGSRAAGTCATARSRPCGASGRRRPAASASATRRAARAPPSCCCTTCAGRRRCAPRASSCGASAGRACARRTCSRPATWPTRAGRSSWARRSRSSCAPCGRPPPAWSRAALRAARS